MKQALFCIVMLYSLRIYANDSTLVDSTLFQSIESHGIAPGITSSKQIISKYSIQEINYIGMTDIISSQLPCIPIQSGDPGLFSSVSMLGSKPYDATMMMHGMSLQDLKYNSVNLTLIAPESWSAISIYTGADAAILGGATGIFFYIKENQYSSVKPFTKMWYSQSAYDYIGTDGTFAQNISDKSSFSLGFRRQTSGGYYNDAGFDQWNIRGQYRYRLNNNETISLSNHFTNIGNYYNGGIKGLSDFSNAITATTQIKGFSSRLFRHDAHILYSFNPYSDTVTVFQATVAFQSSLLEYHKTNQYYNVDSAYHVNYTASKFSTHLRYDDSFINNTLALVTGIGIAYQCNDSSSIPSNANAVASHGYIYGTLHIHPNVSFKSGFRLDYQSSEPLVNIGFGIIGKLDNTISYFADYSQSYRRPNTSEINNSQLIRLDPELHRLLSGTIHYKSNRSNLAITPFYRIVNNPIIGRSYYDTSASFLLGSTLQNGRIESHAGIQTAFSFSVFDNLIFRGTLSYQHSQLDDSIVYYVPALYASVNTEYTHTIQQSTVTAGLRARIAFSTSGYRFIPQQQSFSYESDLSESMNWNGFDVYASAVLGNARIRISLMNALSSTLMDLAGYPLQDNTIRLSVSWSFND